MNDKIQISEEQAREMLEYISIDHDYAAIETNETIEGLRDAGYIKKSNLEEAREYVSRFEEHCDMPEINSYLIELKKVQKYYEQAIEEIQEKNA